MDDQLDPEAISSCPIEDLVPEHIVGDKPAPGRRANSFRTEYATWLYPRLLRRVEALIGRLIRQNEDHLIYEEFSLRAMRVFGQVAAVGGFVLTDVQRLGDRSNLEITAKGPGLDMSFTDGMIRFFTDNGEVHRFDLGEAEELSFIDCFVLAVIMNLHGLPNVASPDRIVAMFGTEAFSTDMIRDIIRQSARLFASGDAKPYDMPMSLMDLLIKRLRGAL